jgi:hypothetical protein
MPAQAKMLPLLLPFLRNAAGSFQHVGRPLLNLPIGIG